MWVLANICNSEFEKSSHTILLCHATVQDMLSMVFFLNYYGKLLLKLRVFVFGCMSYVIRHVCRTYISYHVGTSVS